jgi:hypothetical protein
MDVIVTIPDGTDLDGAVVELAGGLEGHYAAEVRILAQRDRLRRILAQATSQSQPGKLTVANSISPEVYEQAQAAGLIDEDGFSTD